jgi:hypothetical protein
VIRRREFMAGVSAAAAPVLWPLAARAQQRRMPVIGFLDTASPEGGKPRMSQFQRGLSVCPEGC